MGQQCRRLHTQAALAYTRRAISICFYFIFFLCWRLTWRKHFKILKYILKDFMFFVQAFHFAGRKQHCQDSLLSCCLWQIAIYKFFRCRHASALLTFCFSWPPTTAEAEFAELRQVKSVSVGDSCRHKIRNTTKKPQQIRK